MPCALVAATLTCRLPVLTLPKLNGPQRFYARHCPWFRVRGVTWRDTCDEHGSKVLIVPPNQAEQLSVQYHRNTDQECVILTSVQIPYLSVKNICNVTPSVVRKV